MTVKKRTKKNCTAEQHFQKTQKLVDILVVFHENVYVF